MQQERLLMEKGIEIRQQNISEFFFMNTDGQNNFAKLNGPETEVESYLPK